MLAKVHSEAVAGLDGEVVPSDSLAQLVNHLSGVTPIDPFPTSKIETSSVSIDGGLQEVKGQEHAKRALKVAAAGGHTVFMPWTTTRCISSAN